MEKKINIEKIKKISIVNQYDTIILKFFLGLGFKLKGLKYFFLRVRYFIEKYFICKIIDYGKRLL